MNPDQADASTATRIAADGTTEHVEFRGPEGERIFTYRYLPPSRPRGIVLICPSLHGEFLHNYRREVLLGRRLANEGFLVERLHYRGMGNSDGDGSGLSFESMRDDSLRCIHNLRQEADVEALFIVGARLGGLVAASAARNHPDAAVVIWAPLLEGSRFFRDAFRSRLLHERKEGADRPTERQELESQLRSGQSVDLAANAVEPRLFQSARDRSLVAELGSDPRDVLLVQVGPTQAVRSDLARLADLWRTDGLSVDVEVLRGDEAWWLVGDKWSNQDKRSLTRELVECTANWVVARAMKPESA